MGKENFPPEILLILFYEATYPVNTILLASFSIHFSYIFYFQQTSFSSLSLPSLNKTFPVEVTNIYYYVHLAG